VTEALFQDVELDLFASIVCIEEGIRGQLVELDRAIESIAITVVGVFSILFITWFLAMFIEQARIVYERIRGIK